LDVVTVDQILIAQIKLPIGNHRMRPDRSSIATDLGLGVQLKSTSFTPAILDCLDQRDLSPPFPNTIQATVRIGDRTLFQRISLPPDNVARIPVEADPPNVI